MEADATPPPKPVVERKESSQSSTSSLEPKEPFSWLDGDVRGPEYVSYSQLSDLPACAFDFGDNGYAASSNYGGEVLQMTTPSDEHGIIFARGDFEYSLYLALARGQKERGGKSSFGLKVSSSDDFAKYPKNPRYRPCCMIERGCFNYRWPFNEFCLHIDKPHPLPQAGGQPEEESMSCICPGGCRDADPFGGRSSMPVGTFAMVSFIMDGVLYQVLRLDPRHQPAGSESTDKAELILTIEGPMRLQSFCRVNQQCKEEEVVLSECKTHADSACLVGTLDKSTIHWQANLFAYDLSSSAKEKAVSLKPLKNGKEKKDHCFKTDDGLESLPRFQADLEEMDTKSCHVFVAAFRLVVEGTKEYSGVLEAPRHDVVGNFVRSGTPHNRGTASMWRSIFSERQENLDTISELCEESIVGRCLEKILSVDTVPAVIQRGTPPVRHLAIVSNMFLRANVDLKAVFWKTRFLVKVDKLLYEVVKTAVERPQSSEEGHHSGHTQPCTLQAQDTHDKQMSAPLADERWYTGPDDDIIVAEATIRRIRYAIGETMAYMVKTLLKQSTSSPSFFPDAAAGNFVYHYVMITICYVVNHYPKTLWCWQDELGKRGTGDLVVGADWGFGALGKYLPSRRTSPGLHRSHAVNRVKTAMLEWLHHESIASLQDYARSRPVVPSVWYSNTASSIKLTNSRHAAKTELVKRIASAQPYRPDDEVADRLAFLAEEMLPDSDEAQQIVRRITKRVEEREVTRTINLCHFDPGLDKSDEGPWEVHALCHHSRFVVALQKMCDAAPWERKETEEQVEHYRKKFYPFLTSEASLTPCWERNNSSARRGFLRSEATAVLGATLIDMFRKDMKFFQAQAHHAPPSSVGRRPSITVVGAGSDAGRSVSGGGDGPPTLGFLGKSDTYAARAYLRQKGEKVDTDDLLMRQLETLEQMAKKKGLERQIDYLQFRPPQRYHPEEFFNSLDDTPELYEDDAMKERELKMPIAIRDILAETSSTSAEAGTSTAAPDDGIEGLMGEKDAQRLREILVGRKPSAVEADNVRMAADQLRKLAVIDLVTPDPLPNSKPRPVRDKRIVKVISDSLIDQEVRHRFLVVKASCGLPTGLLRVLVHLLHPENLECFNHHQLHVSRFGLWTRQATAVVHITLRSWALVPKSGQFTATKEDDKIRLPDHLRKRDRIPQDMELKVSSIGMSTNEFGDFSKCTIVTDLIPPDVIDKLGEEAQEIWDAFTHQPQTGRFLVFSIALGHLCRGMVAHYNQAAKDFVSKTQLEQQVPSYLQDPSKLQERDADAELRLRLWSLEALYKLSDTVSTTVKTISEAIADITKEINDAPGTRSKELETECLTHLETLERSFSDLTAMQTSLERKVELNTRYSNALSAVLALRASRDSYKQNNTIQRLTYLTIGCLPIALAAAIFAVPADQNVLNPSMGRKWFVGTVVFFAIAIFMVAYFLGDMLKFVRRMSVQRILVGWFRSVVGWFRCGQKRQSKSAA